MVCACRHEQRNRRSLLQQADARRADRGRAMGSTAQGRTAVHILPLGDTCGRAAGLISADCAWRLPRQLPARQLATGHRAGGCCEGCLPCA
jgi:hypothetical protein